MTDWFIRWNAALSLGQIGDVRALVPLTKALHDPSRYVRRNAAEAFRKLRDKKARTTHSSAERSGHRCSMECSRCPCKLKDVRAAEPLIHALKDEDEFVQERAADALGKIGDERAVGPLLEAVSNSSEDVKVTATEALVSIGTRT